MAQVWQSVVERVAALLGLLSSVYGGNLALAILTLSAGVRVALLPFMLRISRRGRETKAKLEALRPELERLKDVHAKDPARLSAETLALYRTHEVTLFHPATLWLLVVQLPLFSALYAAIQRGLAGGGVFLWIKDLARPDLALIGAVLALTALSSVLQPDAALSLRLAMAVIAAASTAFILWNLSSGLALYWGASAAVGVAQVLWIRREVRREPLTRLRAARSTPAGSASARRSSPSRPRHR